MNNLGKLGVNIQQIKNHLRSNSVGGIGHLDHQKIIKMIQENIDQNRNSSGNSNKQQEFNKMFKNPELPNEGINLEALPLNILSRDQFIDMIKGIVGNNELLDQLK